MSNNEAYHIRNPRTGQNDYTIAIATEVAIQELCGQLKVQQAHWHTAGVAYRIAQLQLWKNAILANRQVLLDALCTDTGRKWESILEVDLVAASIDRWCGIAENFFTPTTHKKTAIPFIELQQAVVPFELVGVISPWNFPLLLSLIDTIPALLAGSAVIVKPSEVTPRFIKVIQETIAAVPELKNVFQYIEGDGKVGAALVNNCNLICFTGSTATGKKVYNAASKKMIPVFLELGGKDPAIVLANADIEKASAAILWGSTANAGQSCLSIERVYVHEAIFDDFVQSIVDKAAKVQLAYPTMDSGVIAPIIFEKQVHIINEHLQDALDKGATIMYGDNYCQLLGGGYYLRPTILTNVTHDMKVMQEETFGPIIPIMSFANVDEAITLANDTIYGLSGAVFAATNEEAIAVAAKIEGGAISINDAALTAVMHEGEKNSFKLSGIGGTRMGPNAIKRFMRQKVFIIKNQSIDSPWWYKN
jgi:succinate-semialdehyde dehydrogenase / glutarate-semialdehyde dehydrogenase